MKPCREWDKSRFKAGYGQDKSIPGEQYAHRAEWIRHHGPIPEGMKVLHKCDNPPCREISHLFLGTSHDNTSDMITKRRHMHGDNHVHTTMTTKKVVAIRKLKKEGHRVCDLAAMFNISRTAASNIISGRRWGHIPLE
jgi:hypothetical protein